MRRPLNKVHQQPKMVHHTAYITYDAQATVDFYTRVMGLEFCSAVMDSRLPSTKEPLPYFHIFFKLPDGSHIAFFECPGIPPRQPVPHVAHHVFNHLALTVDTREEVDAWAEWLASQGVEVIGPVDHKIIYSVYFSDNNGLRSEITTDLDPDWSHQPEQAARDLALWEQVKASAVEADGDVSKALFDAIERERELGTIAVHS